MGIPHSLIRPAPGTGTAAPAPGPAGSPAGQVPVYVPAHGGAGATVWASVLGGRDGGPAGARCTPAEGTPVVLVCRGSVDGITAAKQVIAARGVSLFACALVVPAGPGRTPRLIAHELKVLAGALPVIRVPWVPVLLLKHGSRVGPGDVCPKDLHRIHTALTAAGATVQGEKK